MDADQLLNIVNSFTLGALVASSVFAWKLTIKLKKTMPLIDSVQANIDASLAAARRVLESPIVKGEPREALLILLHGLSDRKFGVWLLDRMTNAEPDFSRKKTSLAEAIDDIREQDPSLADDLDLAMVGISNIALPMAFKVAEVAEIASRPPTSEHRVASFVGGLVQMRRSSIEGQMSLSV
jgi:uncharacterized membrane protein